jgi:Flp pilus assembly protein TadG
MLVMARPRCIRRGLPGGDSGAAAVEFAIVGPMLIVLLMGIASYGGYFWLAHSVQQLANDSARAAMGGLDDTERQSLAKSSLDAGLANYAYLKPPAASVTVASQPQQIAITVNYDASGSPFWALGALIPMPPSLIRRQAVVRLGGY